VRGRIRRRWRRLDSSSNRGDRPPPRAGGRKDSRAGNRRVELLLVPQRSSRHNTKEVSCESRRALGVRSSSRASNGIGMRGSQSDDHAHLGLLISSRRCSQPPNKRPPEPRPACELRPLGPIRWHCRDGRTIGTVWPRMISKVLVANRGEIAIRAFCAADASGIGTVAVYPYEDRSSPHRLADEASR
jgi:Biotin carboxylase, N-terminal domain